MGGGHATTLMPGAAMAALPQTGVTSWPTWWVPMPVQNQTVKPLTLVESRRSIANAPRGVVAGRLSHCEATNPRRQRHHRPAGRRAKRGLAAHFTGRRHTVNPCLTDCKRSAVRRVTVRGRVPGARVRVGVGVCQRPPALALGCMADHYCVVIFSSHLSLVGSRHTWRVLMTTGRPHGQGKVVSPPKVLLAVQAWPSDPKHSLVVWVTWLSDL